MQPGNRPEHDPAAQKFGLEYESQRFSPPPYTWRMKLLDVTVIVLGFGLALWLALWHLSEL